MVVQSVAKNTMDGTWEQRSEIGKINTSIQNQTQLKFLGHMKRKAGLQDLILIMCVKGNINIVKRGRREEQLIQHQIL